MRNSVRVISVLSAALITTASVSIALASPPIEISHTAHTLLPGSGFVAQGEIANADGTFADTWTKDGDRVTVSGKPGIVVGITPEGVSASSSIDETQSNAGQLAIAAYAGAGRSVVKDAIAVGVDPKLAERLFGGITSTATLRSKADTQTTDDVRDGVAAISGVINSWCVQLSSDNGKVVSDACDVQNLDQDNGNEDWYIADQQQVSGVSHDTNIFTPDRLSDLWVWVDYSSGNQVVQWQPLNNRPYGNCTNDTVSMSSIRTGIQYSVSGSVCPEFIGPYNLDTGTTNTKFGATWHGLEPQAEWYEGTMATDLVHKPSGACNCPILHVSHHWNNW